MIIMVITLVSALTVLSALYKITPSFQQPCVTDEDNCAEVGKLIC